MQHTPGLDSRGGHENDGVGKYNAVQDWIPVGATRMTAGKRKTRMTPGMTIASPSPPSFSPKAGIQSWSPPSGGKPADGGSRRRFYNWIPVATPPAVILAEGGNPVLLLSLPFSCHSHQQAGIQNAVQDWIPVGATRMTAGKRKTRTTPGMTIASPSPPSFSPKAGIQSWFCRCLSPVILTSRQESRMRSRTGFPWMPRE